MLSGVPMSDGQWTHPPVRRYANWLEVGFDSDEFVLDFGQRFDETARLHSGIIATPRCVKAFVDTLQRSLDEHRQRHAIMPPGEDR